MPELGFSDGLGGRSSVIPFRQPSTTAAGICQRKQQTFSKKFCENKMRPTAKRNRAQRKYKQHYNDVCVYL